MSVEKNLSDRNISTVHCPEWMPEMKYGIKCIGSEMSQSSHNAYFLSFTLSEQSLKGAVHMLYFCIELSLLVLIKLSMRLHLYCIR